MRDEMGSSRTTAQRGVTLVFVALALVGLLGVMALAIDLGILYVARSEAQRAADAAALAGAEVFYTEGCTSASGGCYASGPQESPAAAQAIAVAGRNYVIGQPGYINCPEYTNPSGGSTSCPGIAFNYPIGPGLSYSEEPQITVQVIRSNIPTIFAKVFGPSFETVSATAVAEAYNPTGGSASTEVACVAPFLVPNCDPTNTSNGVNPGCPSEPTQSSGYFINPGSNPPSTATVEPNVTGEQWALHFGSGTTSTAATPSEWFLDAIWPSGTPSKAQLRSAIQECVPVSCGQGVPAVPGKAVGPVDQGVEAKIGASGSSFGCPNNCNFNQGQDTIQAVSGGNPPYQIYAGSNNPLVLAGQVQAGAAISPQQSPSVVTVAVYDGAVCGTTEADGTVLTTSNSDCLGSGSNQSNGPKQVVLGWMTIFIEGYTHGGTYDGVQSMILSTSTCGSSGSSTPPVVTAGSSPIPIRLIQHAD